MMDNGVPASFARSCRHMSASFQPSWLHRLWRVVPAEDSRGVQACTMSADPGETEVATQVRPRADDKTARAGLAARSNAAAELRLGGASRTAARRDFGLPL